MIIAIVFSGSLLLAAFCVWYFSDQQMRKRTILAAPRSTIAQAQPGMVAKLTGRVSYLTECRGGVARRRGLLGQIGPQVFRRGSVIRGNV